MTRPDGADAFAYGQTQTGRKPTQPVFQDFPVNEYVESKLKRIRDFMIMDELTCPAADIQTPHWIGLDFADLEKRVIAHGTNGGFRYGELTSFVAGRRQGKSHYGDWLRQKQVVELCVAWLKQDAQRERLSNALDFL